MGSHQSGELLFFAQNPEEGMSTNKEVYRGTWLSAEEDQILAELCPKMERSRSDTIRVLIKQAARRQEITSAFPLEEAASVG